MTCGLVTQIFFLRHSMMNAMDLIKMVKNYLSKRQAPNLIFFGEEAKSVGHDSR